MNSMVDSIREIKKEYIGVFDNTLDGNLVIHNPRGFRGLSVSDRYNSPYELPLTSANIRVEHSSNKRVFT